MKVKSGYMLREIAGHYVIIPLGSRTVEFTGVITLNEMGAFLWKNMESETTEDELMEKVTAEYKVDAETAKQDMQEFIKILEDNSLLEQGQ